MSNLFSTTIWLMLREVFLCDGVIDNCKVTDFDSYSSGEVFDKIAHNEDESITSRHIILSVLLHICPCNNGYPYYASSYTSETFQVLVLAVGQRNGTVPSTVRSIIQYPHQTEVDLKEDQYLQKTSNIILYQHQLHCVFTVSHCEHRVTCRR